MSRREIENYFYDTEIVSKLDTKLNDRTLEAIKNLDIVNSDVKSHSMISKALKNERENKTTVFKKLSIDIFGKS